MWRARRSGEWLMVVGLREVECGLLTDGQWRAESLLRQAIESGRAASAAGLANGLKALADAVVQARAVTSSAPVVTGLRVLVLEHWLSSVRVPWERGGVGEPQARAQLRAAGCDVGHDDVVCLGRGGFARPRWAVGYPHELIDGLEAMARQLRVELRSVAPLGAAAWRFAQDASRGRAKHRAQGPGQGREDALGVLGDGWFVLLHGKAAPSEATMRCCGGDEDGDGPHAALHAQWQRLQMRDPQRVSWGVPACLDLRGHAEDIAVNTSMMAARSGPSPALELARRVSKRCLDGEAVPSKPHVGWLGGIALAAVAAVAAVALLQATQATAEARDARQALASAAANAARPKAVQRRVWTREEMARVQAVNTAVRELNLPVRPLLNALQPPADLRVVLLRIDLQGAAPGGAEQLHGIKLTAQAPSAAEMARYVGFLGETKPLKQAYLTHHEWVEVGAERSYRFTVEAGWLE